MATSPHIATAPAPGDRKAHGTEAAHTEPARRQRPPVWRRAPYLIVLALTSVLFTYPFVWLISASFKPRTEVFDNALVPHHWRPVNFSDVWHYGPVLTWLGNS